MPTDTAHMRMRIMVSHAIARDLTAILAAASLCKCLLLTHPI